MNKAHPFSKDGDWMPSVDFEMTVIFLVIEERCCVRSCLLSKGQFISKNDRTFLAMIVDFERRVSRQKLSKFYHLVKKVILYSFEIDFIK